MLEKAITELIKVLATGRVYIDLHEDLRIPSYVIATWIEHNTLYTVPGIHTLVDKISQSLTAETIEFAKDIDHSVSAVYGDIIITKNLSIVFSTGSSQYMIGLDLKDDFKSLYRCYEQYLKATSKTKPKNPETSLFVKELCGNGVITSESRHSCKPLSRIFSMQKGRVCNLIKSLHRSNKLGTQYGVSSISAIMLYGKPGTGKTEMIRSIAYDLQLKFIGKGARFSYTEVPPSTMEAIGRVEKSSYDFAPYLRAICNASHSTSRDDFHLILFDDCDSWLGNRDDLDSSASADSREAMMYNFTMNFMKILSDGIPGRNILIVFTTNYLDRIDKALLRAGRIDHCIEITDIPKNLAEKMVESFDENPDDILKNESFPINPAYLQQQILVHKFGADRVRTNLTTEGTTANEENA